MKITWASNAPWAPTGYGGQTAQVIRRLRAAGHEVAVAANFGLAGNVTAWEDFLVLPMGTDAYSNDVLAAHHQAWTKGEPGIILSLYDVWVLQDPADFPIASWTPVDHLPVPPKVAAWARTHDTIAMSRFGQQALHDIGIEAPYVPHAIERVFHPTPAIDGIPTRTSLGIPADAFVVMVNAANKGNVPPRKAWGEMLSAFALFARNHSDAVLFIQTDAFGQGGVDLPLLFKALDLSTDQVKVCDQYAYKAGLISEDILAAYYTMADVLLATSMGEGFGVPVIEAQACGTPVIVTDFSAQPELVGAGWKVPYQPWWDFTQAAWLAMPLIREIARALESAYEARGDAGLSGQAIAKAAEYDADRVFAEHWTPVLASLEAKIHPRPKVVPLPVNRAQRRQAGRHKKLAAVR